MNHRAAWACARMPPSVARAVGTTRITPSPPMPARRSASRDACCAVRSRRTSRSGTSTKAFSVPWPWVKAVWSAMRPIVPDRCPDQHHRLLGQVGGQRVEPDDARVGVEPRLLTASEAPGQRGRLLLRLLSGEDAVELSQGLRVAERARGGSALAQPQGL